MTYFILTLLMVSCTGNKQAEEDKTEQSIELVYISWACDCANWVTPDDIDSFHHDPDILAARSVFIEPAYSTLTLPDTLGYNNDIIRFTGQFYTEKGFPAGFNSKENPTEARVFRYTAYQVIRSNHHHQQN